MVRVADLVLCGNQVRSSVVALDPRFLGRGERRGGQLVPRGITLTVAAPPPKATAQPDADPKSA